MGEVQNIGPKPKFIIRLGYYRCIVATISATKDFALYNANNI